MTAARATPLSFGERRHELCRFGRLTEAFVIEGDKETPTLAPLCTWDPPGPTPPALQRVWGGLIEVERDCAVCWCFQEAPAAPVKGLDA